MSATEQQKEPAAWLWVAGACSLVVMLAQCFLERDGNSFIRASGVASLLLSGVFIFPPFLLLARRGGCPSGKPYYHTTEVVDRGIYSIVRHPQYVGYILLTLGFAALAQHAITWSLAVCSAIGFCLQSLSEEASNRSKLGEDYLEYMQRVPRFNFLAGLFRLISARTRRG